MMAAPRATTREIAAAAGRAREPARAARVPVESRRKLRVMELRDGRVRLVDATGEVFMACATVAMAERMRCVFAP